MTNVAKEFQYTSSKNHDPPNNYSSDYFPTRLEHSYFNDRVYWSLGPISNEESINNITIHPRISWNKKITSTEPTHFFFNSTNTRKWRWPTATSTEGNVFPFEHLTHGYSGNLDEKGWQVKE